MAFEQEQKAKIMDKRKTESTKEESETKRITVIFSLDTFKKVVQSLSATMMCCGALLMEDDKAMHKIIMAIAAGKDSVLI